MKFLSSLMLKNFRRHLSWKLSWTPSHKWSPLFQCTWTRLNFPLQKGLTYCTEGRKTWFTGAPLIEIGIYKYQLARRWCESEKMPCHAILKKLWNSSGDWDNKTCFASYFADQDVYRRFVKHNYVRSFIHCHKICLYVVFFTVNSSVNATGSSLNGVCRRKFHGNGIKLKTFPHGYVISLWGVVVRRRAEGQGSTYSVPYLFFLLSFFSVFFVVVFYKYIPK